MSKRKQEYQDGVERICTFLEAYLHEGTRPPLKEVHAEFRAIGTFRSVEWEWVPLGIAPEEGSTVLVEETYDRYDRVVPDHISFREIPLALADPETFQRTRVLHPEG